MPKQLLCEAAHLWKERRRTSETQEWTWARWWVDASFNGAGLAKPGEELMHDRFVSFAGTGIRERNVVTKPYF